MAADYAVFSGAAHVELAESIARKLGRPLGRRTLERFPDGELHIEIDECVRGQEVYVIQPLGPPVGENLLELLLLADACRRAGAARLTAVVPYLGYARQDRRAQGREPVSARVIADLIRTSGIMRVLALDLHSSALEGMFSIPVEHLSASSVLLEAARPWAARKSVVASPDLGGAKLAERFARHLNLPVAIVRKVRLTGQDVNALGVVGEVSGRAVLLVDDMISTGGTIEAAVHALLQAGCTPDIYVVATHALFAGPAVERLRPLPIRRFITTDSLPLVPGLPLPIQVIHLAGLLATAIMRLQNNESLSELRAPR